VIVMLSDERAEVDGRRSTSALVLVDDVDEFEDKINLGAGAMRHGIHPEYSSRFLTFYSEDDDGHERRGMLGATMALPAWLSLDSTARRRRPHLLDCMLPSTVPRESASRCCCRSG